MALAAMAVLTVALLHADPALAALFLIFDHTSGSPGTLVGVQTGGNGGCRLCPSSTHAYWVAASLAGDVSDPRDPRLVAAGHLDVDAAGNGKGTITVPSVPNGPYVVMVYCPACAPHSAGRSLLPVGPDPPFVVSGSTVTASSTRAPVARAGSRAGAAIMSPVVWLVIALVTSTLVGGGVLLLSKRPGRS